MRVRSLIALAALLAVGCTKESAATNAVPPPVGQDIVQPLSSAAMNRLKRVPAALPGHLPAPARQAFSSGAR